MKEINDKLNRLLATYQMHYQNLRGFHWNIEGIQFFTLHAKFEDYYNEASEIIDGIAERIRTLGGTPLHAFVDYVEKSAIKASPNVTDGIEAARIALSGMENILQQLREILKEASQKEDEGTVSMISGLIESTEKNAWMLRSFLK